MCTISDSLFDRVRVCWSKDFLDFERVSAKKRASLASNWDWSELLMQSRLSMKEIPICSSKVFITIAISAVG